MDERILPSEHLRVKVPPKFETARRILVRALEEGRISISPHFEQRCDQRGFTTIDAELLIRHGKPVEQPRLDREFNNYVYEIVGKVDGKVWKLVVALDCEEDFWESPLVTLITAHRTGGRYDSKVPSLQKEDGK